LPKNLQARSPLRKVSLVRLEAAVQAQLAAGKKLDEPTRCLAGLQRLQYVFFLPEAKDIVIAGPAEGFAADASGRMVGLGSGRPVIELEDLVAALRAYARGRPAEGFVGCTIDPAPEAMLRLQGFQRTVPTPCRRPNGPRSAARLPKECEMPWGWRRSASSASRPKVIWPRSSSKPTTG